MDHRKLFEGFTNKKKKLTMEDDQGKVAVPTKLKANADPVVPGELKELAGLPNESDAMQKLEEEKGSGVQEKGGEPFAAFSSSEDEKQDAPEAKEFTIFQSPITGCQHECILPINYVRKGREGSDGGRVGQDKAEGEGVQVHIGPVSTGVNRVLGAERVGVGGGTYKCREDCGGGVRDSDGIEEQAKGDIHLSHKSFEQPEVPGVRRRVPRRRSDDRRCDTQPSCLLSGDDHRDLAQHALQRL